MRNKKWVNTVAVVLCIASLTGCGSADTLETDQISAPVVEQNPQTEKGSEHTQQENAGTSSQEESSQSGNIDDLLNTAAATGNVTEFSDGILQVLPEITKDEGQTMLQAAPGMEEGMRTITVRYDETCQFQIAEIDGTTGAAQFTESSAAEVKKQTSVAVFGEKQDSGEILATKILITRYSNAVGVAG